MTKKCKDKLINVRIEKDTYNQLKALNINISKEIRKCLYNLLNVKTNFEICKDKNSNFVKTKNENVKTKKSKDFYKTHELVKVKNKWVWVEKT